MVNRVNKQLYNYKHQIFKKTKTKTNKQTNKQKKQKTICKQAFFFSDNFIKFLI